MLDWVTVSPGGGNFLDVAIAELTPNVEAERHITILMTILTVPIPIGAIAVDTTLTVVRSQDETHTQESKD